MMRNHGTGLLVDPGTSRWFPCRSVGGRTSRATWTCHQLLPWQDLSLNLKAVQDPSRIYSKIRVADSKTTKSQSKCPALWSWKRQFRETWRMEDARKQDETLQASRRKICNIHGATQIGIIFSLDCNLPETSETSWVAEFELAAKIPFLGCRCRYCSCSSLDLRENRTPQRSGNKNSRPPSYPLRKPGEW